MEKDSNFRKTYSSLEKADSAQKLNFPTVLNAFIFLLFLTQFEIADARTSVFDLTVQEPENLGKLITKAASKYKLERRLLSCLYKVESNYQVDATSTTNDYGIGQINIYMIKALKLDKHKLLTDLKYSVYRSASILSYYQQLKRAEEPRTWICRYNVGPGSLSKPGRGLACENYLEKVNKCRSGRERVI